MLENDKISDSVTVFEEQKRLFQIKPVSEVLRKTKGQPFGVPTLIREQERQALNWRSSLGTMSLMALSSYAQIVVTKTLPRQDLPCLSFLGPKM